MMIDSFLKWPGGKRWLVSNYGDLFPKEYARYVEPFLGGGSVFFSVKCDRALISDSNPHLINAYKVIKAHPDRLERALRKLHGIHSKEMYYMMRSAEPTDPFKKAVRFIYLNRTCFNGIYRVNRTGQFNVPMGSKTAVSYPPGYLRKIAAVLKKARIRANDFDRTLAEAGKDDFVFVDPPYTVMHNSNGFIKYNAKLFSWGDQTRLHRGALDAVARGAMVMVCNADHSSIRELYKGFGKQTTVNRASVLAGDPTHRRASTELVITSYLV